MLYSVAETDEARTVKPATTSPVPGLEYNIISTRPSIPGILLLVGLLSLAPGPLRGDELPARTALDDYVAAPDPSYSWKLLDTIPLDGFTSYIIELVSQTWRQKDEVDRTLWKHWLTIVRPDDTTARTALLVIGGGSNRSSQPKHPDAMAAGLAVTSRAVVAGLAMIPNQPLAFSEDGRPRVEDDLIAHTWNRAMDTGDPTWVAHMPMVKAAVRAMDTVTAFLQSSPGGGLKVDRFVVAGGSKRGWTTWLTGAVDPRVVSIVPIVIDVVNVIPSMEHHRSAYGFWAPAVGDYVRNGVMDRRRTPEYSKLIRLVDPYFYRHRLRMPKLLLNGSGDQFFLPDSSRFYFDDLLGEKYLRYVPNTDHSLARSDAVDTLQAWFQAIVTGTPRPKFAWHFDDDGSIRVNAEHTPKSVLLWQATNPDARDFRLKTIGPAWKSTTLPLESGAYTARLPRPDKGWTGFFVELTFASGGPKPFKFTTPVRVLPDVLPFAARRKVPDRLVVLTFDDSVKSHATVVGPLLKNYGFGATFYITEGFTFRTNKSDYMSWEEIRGLHDAGFEIGNHTRDHMGVTAKNVDRLQEQLESIAEKCRKHGIPKPTTFAWPGNSIATEAFDVLREHGIRFARRGGSPEHPYEKGRGFAYEPGLDHPLLVPSAGDARPLWTLDDFRQAAGQARDGRIAVLQFHGCPEGEHPWVHTPRKRFAEYMKFLHEEGYTAIALRDLERYVDPDRSPQDPWDITRARAATVAPSR